MFLERECFSARAYAHRGVIWQDGEYVLIAVPRRNCARAKPSYLNNTAFAAILMPSAEESYVASQVEQAEITLIAPEPVPIVTPEKAAGLDRQ